MNKYLLYENDQCLINVLIDTDNLDYYTDLMINVNVMNNEYTIYEDNYLYLKNILNNFNIKNIGSIDERKLGLLLNVYYKTEPDDNSDDRIIKDVSGTWIGNKFRIFESPSKCATWLFKKEDKYIIKVTPIYDFDNESEEQFNSFISHYHDILNIELNEIKLKSIYRKLEELLNMYKE